MSTRACCEADEGQQLAKHNAGSVFHFTEQPELFCLSEQFLKSETVSEQFPVFRNVPVWLQWAREGKHFCPPADEIMTTTDFPNWNDSVTRQRDSKAGAASRLIEMPLLF